MNLKEYSKYFFVIYIVIIIAIVALMIKPIFSTLLLSILISIMFLPVYKKLLRKTKKRNLSAAITILLIIIAIILLVIIPTSLFIKLLSQEVFWKSYIDLKLRLNAATILGSCSESDLICQINTKITGLYQQPAMREAIDNALDDMLLKGTAFVSSVILQLPNLLLHLFIMLFSSFFIIRDFDYLAERAQKLIPLSSYYTHKLTNKIKITLNSIVYGSIVVAIAQGFVATLGYFILGVDNAILFGVLTAFVAFIPYIGTMLVWGLLALKKILVGYAIGNSYEVLTGIILFLYGAFVISVVDNILKPKLIGTKANVHPLLILIGIVGGAYLFGLPGLLLGPIIMALFDSVVTFYEEVKHSETK